MRDRGLNEAIQAAGGVGILARKIGISQPSVSNWSRVPADRVLSVEAATGVSRLSLRPDLYEESRHAAADVDPIDEARAQEYALLAALLGSAPDAAFLTRLAGLRGDATALGGAHDALAAAARESDADRAGREFFELFIGVGRGELLPYASYYLTGFLHERPLARLRADLARLGIERSTNRGEPEDHAATLCEVMAGLAGGDFTSVPGSDRRFFDAHLSPWIGRFFADLERSEKASFYRSVGALGRIFTGIETEAFALAS